MLFVLLIRMSRCRSAGRTGRAAADPLGGWPEDVERVKIGDSGCGRLLVDLVCVHTAELQLCSLPVG